MLEKLKNLVAGGGAEGPPSEALSAAETRRLQDRLVEAEALLGIAGELSSSLDLGTVLHLAMEMAETLCSAQTSSVWELDEGRGELFFRVVRGRVADEIRDLRVALGEGIVGSVAESGRSEVVDDVEADPRWQGDRTGSFQTRSILAVPLKVQGRVIGVLQLLNPIGRQGFDAADVRRIELFAGIVAPAIENARLYAERRHQFIETVTALAEAIDKRDPYTGGHVRRVVLYSLLLGADLDLPPEELEKLCLAASLHDVGKIAIPDEILAKPAALDDDERLVIRRHPIDGANIVARIGGMQDLLPGILYHHERIDGGGYPHGLAGDEIPMLARLIAVADTFDAMTASRPYRDELTRAQAIAEIVSCAGSQFCPLVVGSLKNLFSQGRFELEEGRLLLESLSEEGVGGLRPSIQSP